MMTIAVIDRVGNKAEDHASNAIQDSKSFQRLLE